MPLATTAFLEGPAAAGVDARTTRTDLASGKVEVLTSGFEGKAV
jgi:hypothetical protein